MVERKNRDLKTQLAILVGNHHDQWPVKLPAIRFALNTTRCQTTSHTAAYLTFGRELRTPYEVTTDIRAIIQNENFVPEVTPRLLQLADTLHEVRDLQEQRQDQRKDYADAKRRPAPVYQPGDLVLIDTHPISKGSKRWTAKFAPKRDGPYVILTARGPCSYEVAASNKPNQPLGVYHVSALRPAKPMEDTDPVVPIRRRGRPRKKPAAPTSEPTSRRRRGSEGGEL